MTRISKVRSRNVWQLQSAKARFSELVRRAHEEGPQSVTLHGREKVVVLDAGEFQRLKGQRRGDDLVKAMRESPARNVDLAPARSAAPVRDVRL